MSLGFQRPQDRVFKSTAVVGHQEVPSYHDSPRWQHLAVFDRTAQTTVLLIALKTAQAGHPERPSDGSPPKGKPSRQPPHFCPTSCCCCCCWGCSLTDSSPRTLLAAMNLHRQGSAGPQAYSQDFLRRGTHSPPCQLPSPRMHSAWTLVIRRRFSVLERLAESWASCECS